MVLVVNEVGKFKQSRERFDVGLSRARDQLVVCGHPDFIREVAQCAASLTAAESFERIPRPATPDDVQVVRVVGGRHRQGRHDE